jgi:hypothetical protein
VPASVHDANVAEVQPQRQSLEPLQVLGALDAADLIQKCLMLTIVFAVVVA